MLMTMVKHAEHLATAGGPDAGIARTYTIFLVDDDETYLSALGYLLLKKNPTYKVHCYNSGEACLQHLGLAPSVIVLDYNLNGKYPGAISGIEMLRKLRLLCPGAAIVVLSGQKDIDVALDTLKEGAYTYIVKDKQAISSLEKLIESLQKNPAARLAGGGAN